MSLVVALVSLLLALAVPERLLLMSGLTTFALMLLLDPSGGWLETGGTRVLSVALAGVLVLGGAAVMTWWGRSHAAPREGAELAAELVREEQGLRA